MYCKLALKNVKKSFKDYLIYFLTLAFSICLFYAFNSFQSQQAVMEMSEKQVEIIGLVKELMQMLSVFVALVLGFLIIYANNFLIKRRKKELGLYTLLGMPKNRISRVLVYETVLVGLLSLIMGMISGVLISQLLTIVTANLFEAKLNYTFVFSMDATWMTIKAFALIFIIVMIFNTFILNRYQLIDLLTAGKKNETLKIKNIYVSIFLFIASIAILAFTYWFALSNGFNALMYLHIIAPCGIIGTLLFFMSLAGFLLRFVQSSQSLYYRKLNMFVLRQINASINSNFLSMSVVCIMLLFSIGALATGTNLTRTLNQSLVTNTPYDFTYASLPNWYEESDALDITAIKEDLRIDRDWIQSDSFVHTYLSQEYLSEFLPFCEGSDCEILEVQADYYNGPFEVIPLSEFNEIRKQYDLEPVSLQKNEGYMFTSAEMLTPMINNILSNDPTISIYGNDVHIINEEFDLMNTGTTSGTTVSFAVVLPDQAIPNDAPLNMVQWNVTLKEGASQQEFSDLVEKRILEWNQNNESQSMQYQEYYSASEEEVKESSKGLSVMMTYIGLYLGLVFLMASAVILALQQLSQASDNKHRYQILNKIGAESKMVSHSLLLQLSIYFFMPLLLAVVHSVVGIQVVNAIVVAFGKSDLFGASLITGGIILLIYGAYFMITYLGCKRIITKS